MKAAVIIGSTGLVGSELVKALSYSKHYEKIYVISRRQIEFADKNIETVVLSFEDLAQQNFPAGADYFCALGTTIKQAGSEAEFRKVDYNYVVSFAKVAKACEANSFHMVSALGSDANSSNFYSRVKGEAENDITDLGLKKVRIYQPSLLIGKRGALGQPRRLAEEVFTTVYNNTKFLFKGFMKKYEPITAENVALAMAKNAIANSDKINQIISNQEMH
jgi:uncharacterized protein YbjT (DUF2867 family)